MANNNNRYGEEFKRDAVKLVKEKGRTVNSVAKELGVPEPTIRRWVSEARVPIGKESERILELEKEIKMLKKERDEAREVADILKKSLGIFART